MYTSDHYPNGTLPGLVSTGRLDLAKALADRPPQTCDVCYEDLGPQALYRQLPCQHTFHKACIDQWICKRDASCPFCRRTFYHLRQPFAIYKAATGPMHVRTEEDKTRGLGDTLASWWRRLA